MSAAATPAAWSSRVSARRRCQTRKGVSSRRWIVRSWSERGLGMVEERDMAEPRVALRFRQTTKH